ncbi:hypothetical protein MC7420_4602 [Coleofasciculus chthonoplastes PCC 7420]|uniref:PLL-like beta propeller domain-containing protein n=1 Tax=Coleofasciculus chthonoplastes PCC 7420 TaxID=118168 RepID=B4VNK0_9CYAN|nr:hypothetical protein [Coleofasciculus chthonoplastes]EDX76346.1 hypothetical protein MC7420_4602 [Coleofasciculus chthonoplastes PCC 7420]
MQLTDRNETSLPEMPSVDGVTRDGISGKVQLFQKRAGQWSSWQKLGGTLISSPAVTAWGEEQMDVFAIGWDSQLYHKQYRDSKWSEWDSLGGLCIFSPAAVSRGENQIDVFAIGLDKHLYRKWRDGSSRWNDWEDLGGICIHGVAATSWGANRIDLFTVGTNSCLYHRSLEGSTWSGWKPLMTKGYQTQWQTNSTCIYAPAAVSGDKGRIGVVSVGIQNFIYYSWWDDSSDLITDWQYLGGHCLHGIAAASASNYINIFTIGTDREGTDNHLYHLSGDGSNWGSWESLGGTCIYAPAAVYRGKNRLDVFVIGTRNAMYQKSWVADVEGTTSPGNGDRVAELDIPAVAETLRLAALSGVPFIEGLEEIVAVPSGSSR